MTAPRQPFSSHACPIPPVRPSDVVAGQSNTGDFNTDFAASAPVETPAENCVSVFLPSSSHTETTADQHKRAGGGLLGSAPRETVASVVSAGQSHHSNNTDSETVAAARRFFEDQTAAETEKQRTRAKKRSRVFSIMQYEQHPTTGAPIYAEPLLVAGLARQSVKRYAWIAHDRDRCPDGSMKPRHWHIVVECEDAYSIHQIASWFSVPSARVRVPKEAGVEYAGRGARENTVVDLVRYLTHENGDPDGQKVAYDRAEVQTNDSALWEMVDANLARRREKRAGAGSRRSKEVDELVLLIQEEGWRLRQARRHDPLAFSQAYSRMEKARAVFLRDAPLPPMRTNFYLGGPSRTGKSVLAGLFARALARAQFPDLTEAEAIFEVGRPGVAFQHYDGQPILLWDDFRPLSIIEAVGGDVRSRDSVWPVLDISPKRVAVNTKYGSATLLNSVNIITGVKPYSEFLDELAGDFVSKKTGEVVRAEDKMQAYGRFPFVSEVTQETIRFYLSRGFSGPGGLYSQYEEIARMGNNMKAIIETIDALPDEESKSAFREAVGHRMLGSMVQAHIDLTTRDEISLDEAMAVLDAAPLTLTGDEIRADDLAQLRQKLESDRSEWAARWTAVGLAPPSAEYDSWMDARCAWAAENGGNAAALERCARGEVPLPPECPLPPPPSAPGIAFR